MAKLAQILSNPVRLRILGILSQGPKHIYAISKELGESYPLTYLYLSSLEKAGLIQATLVEGEQDERQRKVYTLRNFEFKVSPETIRELFARKGRQV